MVQEWHLGRLSTKPVLHHGTAPPLPPNPSDLFFSLYSTGTEQLWLEQTQAIGNMYSGMKQGTGP